MTKIKIIIAASCLLMFQVGSAFAESTVQRDIQKYTNYFKTDFGMNVSVLSSNKTAVGQLEDLDRVLEGQIKLDDRSLNLLECPQPVCVSTGTGSEF